MKPVVQRPSIWPTSGGGALRHEHFQVAYATNDLERACAEFARLGIAKFSSLEGEMPGGGYVQVRLAWFGGIMYELVAASGTAAEFYNRRLSPDEFGLHFHHHGYLLQDQPEWDELMRDIERSGHPIVMHNHTPGFLKVCYIEVAPLGHFLEFILPEQAQIDFFELVAQN